MSNDSLRSDNRVDSSSRGCLRTLAVLFLGWGIVLGIFSLMQVVAAFKDGAPEMMIIWGAMGVLSLVALILGTVMMGRLRKAKLQVTDAKNSPWDYV